MKSSEALKNETYIVSTGLVLAKTSKRGATKSSLQWVFIKSMIQSCELSSFPFPITVKTKYAQTHILFSTEYI